MTIICGPQTAVVGYTSTLVCNKLVKIDNIQPTYPDRADLILEGEYVSAYPGGSALRRENEIWTLFLLSKNVPGRTVTIKLTISSDPCTGITCPDKCIENDLWGYRCGPIYDENLRPVGSKCVQDSTKQENSPRCVTPTHYIGLTLGFVPPELVAYFQTYISAISDNLMTHIAPPPSPWEYVETTYDKTTNTFNIWLYLPATGVLSLSPGALEDIYNYIAAWAPLVIGIMLILIAAFGPFGVLIDIVLLFAGLAILVWKVFDATAGQLLAETIATNLDNQISQNNKELKAKQLVEDAWEKSGKLQQDCLTRLSGYQSVHNAKTKGYLDIYAKYPNFITKLAAESTTFSTNTNAILSEFKKQAYTVDVCSTYVVQIGNEINSSNLKINDLLATFVPPDVPYSVPCKGWTNQSTCETAECFWYDSACHKEEACWIPNPLGGCILSAGTGKVIAGTGLALTIVGVSYWLLTRKKEEVVSIYAGAREAAAAEAERARAAYKAIRPPAVPRITGAPVR